ncbi:hypothetical protein [Vibrio phage VP16T]|nr:hypothetical protein [Vibrio phage VP16T]
MFKYFQVNPDVGHYLVDKYNSTVNAERERIVSHFLSAVGAVGIVMVREWGMPSRIEALVFPATHEICNMEGVKLTEHRQGQVVTFDDNAPFAGHYYEAISGLNAELVAYPDFSDWLHHTMGVTRYALAEKDDEAGTYKKIATHSHLMADGRILFAVPLGNVGQSPIKPDSRMEEMTSAEYEAATKSQF